MTLSPLGRCPCLNEEPGDEDRFLLICPIWLLVRWRWRAGTLLMVEDSESAYVGSESFHRRSG